jgi:hypothetical protein
MGRVSRRPKTNEANSRLRKASRSSSNLRLSSKAQGAGNRLRNPAPEARRHLRRANNRRLNNRDPVASLRLHRGNNLPRQANRRRDNFVRSPPSRGRASRRVRPRRPQDPTARPRVNQRTRLTSRRRRAK